jgi:HEAT repeat protein
LRFSDKAQPQHRVAAGLALWKIDKHPAAVRTLITVLRTDQPRDWGNAAIALAEVGPDGEEAIPDLIEAVRHPKHIHYGACVALGRFGKSARNAVPALLDALERTEHPYSKINVAVALWRIERHPRALPTLTALLKEESSPEPYGTRYHAATTLGELGPAAAAAAPDLIPALRDERSMVRRAAALSLGQLKSATRDVVKALEAALQDEIWTVRAEAARSLGKLGPAAAAALPALREASADRLVEPAAKEAVREIVKGK